jgi:hypothetical protein
MTEKKDVFSPLFMAATLRGATLLEWRCTREDNCKIEGAPDTIKRYFGIKIINVILA